MCFKPLGVYGIKKITWFDIQFFTFKTKYAALLVGLLSFSSFIKK